MEILKELANVLKLGGTSKKIAEYASKFKSENILYSDGIRDWVSKIKETTIKYQKNFVNTILQSSGDYSKSEEDTDPTKFKSIQSWKENLTKVCDELWVLKDKL